MSCQDQFLKVLVRLNDHCGCRTFIDLSRLDSDQAILYMVDPPDAVPAGGLIDFFDQGYTAGFLPVHRVRNAALEIQC